MSNDPRDNRIPPISQPARQPDTRTTSTRRERPAFLHPSHSLGRGQPAAHIAALPAFLREPRDTPALFPGRELPRPPQMDQPPRQQAPIRQIPPHWLAPPQASAGSSRPSGSRSTAQPAAGSSRSHDRTRHSQPQPTAGSSRQHARPAMPPPPLPVAGPSRPQATLRPADWTTNRAHTTSTGPPDAKRYECEVCGKRFERPSSLQVHMVSHTGERPYACHVGSCTRTFSTESNRRRHQRKKHGSNDF